MPNYHSPIIGSIHDAINKSSEKLGVIQYNLENINTVGFKSVHPETVMFSDVLDNVFRDDAQGVMLTTGQKLDLGLTKPNAFFLVESENNVPIRSRDGQFHISQDNKIVDHLGRELVILDKDSSNPIWQELSKTEDIKIERDGRLRINGVLAGRIALDYQSKVPGDRVFVVQGKLETSNVDLQANIVKIMQIKRHIETAQSAMAMELGVDKALLETYGKNV